MPGPPTALLEKELNLMVFRVGALATVEAMLRTFRDLDDDEGRTFRALDDDEGIVCHFYAGEEEDFVGRCLLAHTPYHGLQGEATHLFATGLTVGALRGDPLGVIEFLADKAAKRAHGLRKFHGTFFFWLVSGSEGLASDVEDPDKDSSSNLKVAVKTFATQRRKGNLKKPFWFRLLHDEPVYVDVDEHAHGPQPRMTRPGVQRVRVDQTRACVSVINGGDGTTVWSAPTVDARDIFGEAHMQRELKEGYEGHRIKILEQLRRVLNVKTAFAVAFSCFDTAATLPGSSGISPGLRCVVSLKVDEWVTQAIKMAGKFFVEPPTTVPRSDLESAALSEDWARARRDEAEAELKERKKLLAEVRKMQTILRKEDQRRHKCHNCFEENQKRWFEDGRLCGACDSHARRFDKKQASERNRPLSEHRAVENAERKLTLCTSRANAAAAAAAEAAAAEAAEATAAEAAAEAATAAAAYAGAEAAATATAEAAAAAATAAAAYAGAEARKLASELTEARTRLEGSIAAREIALSSLDGTRAKCEEAKSVVAENLRQRRAAHLEMVSENFQLRQMCVERGAQVAALLDEKEELVFRLDLIRIESGELESERDMLSRENEDLISSNFSLLDACSMLEADIASLAETRDALSYSLNEARADRDAFLANVRRHLYEARAETDRKIIQALVEERARARAHERELDEARATVRERDAALARLLGERDGGTRRESTGAQAAVKDAAGTREATLSQVTANPTEVSGEPASIDPAGDENAAPWGGHDDDVPPLAPAEPEAAEPEEWMEQIPYFEGDGSVPKYHRIDSKKAGAAAFVGNDSYFCYKQTTAEGDDQWFFFGANGGAVKPDSWKRSRTREIDRQKNENASPLRGRRGNA